MTRCAQHRRHLRGFSLVEVLLVLGAIGAIAVMFVPQLGSSATLSAALSAQTSASSALDAIAAAHDDAGNAPGPVCVNTATQTGIGAVTNVPTFANPCALSSLATDTRLSGAGAASKDASSVSIAAVHTGTTWRAAVSVAQSTAATEPATTCQGAVRNLPGGVETLLSYPAPAAGCSAADVLARLAAVDACPQPATPSWRTACRLPS